jgi:hypothetical protein
MRVGAENIGANDYIIATVLLQYRNWSLFFSPQITVTRSTPRNNQGHHRTENQDRNENELEQTEAKPNPPRNNYHIRLLKEAKRQDLWAHSERNEH